MFRFLRFEVRGEVFKGGEDGQMPKVLWNML